MRAVLFLLYFAFRVRIPTLIVKEAEIKAIMVPDRVEPNEEMEEKSVVILKNLMEVKKWLEKNV